MSANPPILTFSAVKPPSPAHRIRKYLQSVQPHHSQFAQEGFKQFLKEQENGFEDVKSHWKVGDSSSAGRWSEVVYGKVDEEPQSNRQYELPQEHRVNENRLKSRKFRANSSLPDQHNQQPEEDDVVLSATRRALRKSGSLPLGEMSLQEKNNKRKELEDDEAESETESAKS